MYFTNFDNSLQFGDFSKMEILKDLCINVFEFDDSENIYEVVL